MAAISTDSRISVGLLLLALSGVSTGAVGLYRVGQTEEGLRELRSEVRERITSLDQAREETRLEIQGLRLAQERTERAVIELRDEFRELRRSLDRRSREANRFTR